MDSSVGGGLQLVATVKTLPDIVDGLRSFLMVAAADGPVVVAIDELDKLDAGGAGRLLNDIKGIFGVRDCHFLISLSEDAMAQFEQRGMPFRDAFDSSFDEVVRVGYLDFAEAQRLLDRRVFNLPVAATGLCFALSGASPEM
jgi:hypothetical protein